MVRDAAVGDAQAIAEVHVRAWRAAYRGFLPGQLLDDLSVGLREDFWIAALGGEGPVTFTLVSDGPDGTAEGFCSVALPSRDDDAGEHTAEIAATYVDPSRWSSGVGRALLSRALARLREDGWQDVTLWVFLRNAQGRAFYARSGFRLDGAKGKHEASGVTITRMRLAL